MGWSRYTAELFGVIAVYGVLLTVSLRIVDGMPDGPLRIAVALLPMVPVLLVPWVVLRRLRALDELQQRIQLEALGFAFAATAVLTLGYGFLERIGFPRPSSFLVWPLMGVLWSVGLAIARWRYR